MSLLRLVAMGAQDTFLTGAPLRLHVPTLQELKRRFDALDWSPLMRPLSRAERVRALREAWQEQSATSARARYLVWAARRSPDSPLCGLPAHVCAAIVDVLRANQAAAIAHSEARYRVADRLLESTRARQGQ
jgi:hypothetical protein